MSRKIKASNVPKAIFLQVGEDTTNTDIDLAEVTWCKDRIFNTDIRYVLDKRQKGVISKCLNKR